MVTWERVVELAAELPDVELATSWGKPSLKVRGKPFAGMSVRAEGAMWARCDSEERALIVASNPDGYRLTPHFERSPAYILIWLDQVDEDDVRERLIDAWLLKAPKRLAAQHAFD